ncbi:conserved hypothetical protein [Methylobacterium sp. 4-46]|uniref:DUF6328 family protein n=1 Tax=unclassified Methylobacterium TaxID=2615210 RepID=UPI000165C978|nr:MULTISPECIES: DUF6328 family protein [Methylobacterium]ACA17867.1 conserved hypothetical protein [Methylobacterium sp. 4-46]WFT77169.1 DUF6328 family protein [Methylobacterium nodulans]
MSLSKKVKVGLDETRILILGSQILLGFQLQGAFRPALDRLPPHDRLVWAAALALITLTVALLITPSVQHRMVEGGRDTRRILRVIGRCAGLSLAPFSLALGADVFLAVERVLGPWAALPAGLLIFGLAVTFWFGLGAARARRAGARERERARRAPEPGPTPLEVKLEQMLTEARVMLPGAQALLGFQLVITFTDSFEALPFAARAVHMAALGLIALTVIWLVAPAAFHRIVYAGEDAPEVHRLGTRFLLAASVTLALGIAADLGVVLAKVLESGRAGLAGGILCLCGLLGLWHAAPLVLRRRAAGAGRGDAPRAAGEPGGPA